MKNQRRQFCFVTFEDEMTVDQVCKQPKQKIGNKECDVKKATTKPDPRLARGGAMGARGRGRGKIFLFCIFKICKYGFLVCYTCQKDNYEK